MEQLSNMITKGLRRTSVWCEKVENKLFGVGKVIDHYMERETPRKKYMCEIILMIPMVMILHQWCLVAPYSTYRIINLMLLLLWLGVSLVMLGTYIHINIRARLRLYLWTSIDITMAWITLVNYWTYQQSEYEMCQEVNVMLWADVTDSYTIPVLMTILARCVYVWMRIADFSIIDNILLQGHVYLVVMVPVLLELLCLINLFPTFMTEVSYWLNITMFTGAVFWESLKTIDKDIEIKKTKINELMAMARTDENVDNRKRYIDEANALNQIVEQFLSGNMDCLRNSLPGKWFVRDSLTASAVCYFGMVLITELILSKNSMYESMNIEYVATVMGNWCTSIITMSLFGAFLSCLTNIIIGCGFFFLTTEVHITEVMNSNTGGVMHMTTLLLFSETNLLSLTYIEKANAMTIVVLFSFYIIIFQTLNVIERKVLGVVNSGMAQDKSFYLRFGILVGLFMIVPTLTTYQVSLQLHADFLSLFFASSNFNLMVLSIFLIVECSLVSLKWYTVQYRNMLEDILHHCHYVKSSLIIFACILQAYFRYMCPYFQAWWLYRLCLTSLVASVSIALVSYVQWTLYKKRQALAILMNTLADVNYEAVDDDEEGRDCAICYSELIHGKFLPCAHTFHKDCLQHWLQVREVCPICNTNV